MHIGAKGISLLGLFLAVSTILVYLSGVMEFNTLFLLILASFLVGIVIREYGIISGISYTIASLFLCFLLAPNKLYCFTYGGFLLYLLGCEGIFKVLIRVKTSFKHNYIFFILKYIWFNLLYFPTIFLAPKLFYGGDVDMKIILLLIIGGQIGLYIYESAHNYFQTTIWGKIRHRILNS